MQRLLISSRVTHVKVSYFIYKEAFYHSTMNMAKHLISVNNKQYVYLCMNRNHFSTSSIELTQSQPAVKASIGRTESTVPLLDQTTAEMASENTEMAEIKLVQQPAVTDKTPLPFEDVPGPFVLKLWEKYWKYVPLLGTQVFCSLLINRFTEGRLSWNRNVTPVKYLFNEYGPIVRIRGPFMGNIIMIHRAEHIAEVLNQEAGASIRSGIDILQYYRLNYRKYRLAGPFSMQSTEWMEVKKKMIKPMEQVVIDSYGKLNSVCDEFINRSRKIRNLQDEVPGDFHEELIRWGMECFCAIMLNKRLGFFDMMGFHSASEPTRLVNALSTAHTYLGRCETGFQVWRFFETPFAKKLFTACDIIDGVIGKYIRQVHLKYEDPSLLAMYEKSNEISKIEKSSLLETLLIEERIKSDDMATILMDMIILGIQAVVNCEAFLLYYLARNPRVQQKLYEEIVSVLPNKHTIISPKDLKNMHYLQACLKESLRLRPAFPYITRMLQDNITLHFYTIPKETYVIMATQLSAQREENFEDPEKFRPERWLFEKIEDNTHTKFNYLPFGYGLRSCMGKDMAEMEMALLTAKLVREFKIEYDYADISSKFVMVNIPNRALRFRLRDRD